MSAVFRLLRGWSTSSGGSLTADYDFNPQTPGGITARQRACRQRNLTSYELSEAHYWWLLQWQRAQLPKSLQTRCQVIHEGVDTNFCQESSLETEGRPRLTYATRGMEPMRGFSEFVEVLPELLRRLPKVEVFIGVMIGLPMELANRRKAVLDDGLSLGSNLLSSRAGCVSWGTSYQIYARCRHHVHCYLTRPFVVSWSLLDAMARVLPCSQ